MATELDLRINTAVEAGESAKSLGELKASLRELQNLSIEYGDKSPEAMAKVTAAAGKVKDRIGDIRAETAALSGEGFENVANSANYLKNSLMNLSFSDATQGVKLLTKSINDLKFSDLSKSVGEFGKSLLALGKSLLTNPLFLLGAAIVLIITNFDKLRNAGGLIGKMFTALGDIIGVVVDALKALSDALNLTDFAGNEKTKNVLDNAQKEQEAIGSRYDYEIEKAKATNKDVTTLEFSKLKAQSDANEAAIANIEKQKKAGINLTDDQKKQLNDLYSARLNYSRKVLELEQRTSTAIFNANRSLVDKINSLDINILNKSGRQIEAIRLSGKIAVNELQTELYKLESNAAGAKIRYESTNKDIQKQSSDQIKRRTELEQLKKELKEVEATPVYGGTILPGIKATGPLTSLVDDVRKKKVQSKIEELQAEIDANEKIITNNQSTRDEMITNLKGYSEQKKLLEEAITKTQKSYQIDEANAVKDANDKKIKSAKELADEEAANRKKLSEADENFLRKRIKGTIDTYKELSTSTKELSQEELSTLNTTLDEIQKNILDCNSTLSEEFGKEITQATDFVKRMYRLQNKDVFVSLDEINKHLSQKMSDRLEIENQSYNDNKAAIQANYDQEILMATKKGEDTLAIEKKYKALLLNEEINHSKNVTQIRQDATSRNIEIANAFTNSYGNLISGMSQIEANAAGKNEARIKEAKKREFNRNKVLGVANVTISTYEAMMRQYKDVPAWAAVALRVLIGAAGAASIAGILGAKYDDGGSSSSGSFGAFSGSGGGSTPGGGGSAGSFAGPAVFSTGFTGQMAQGGPMKMRVSVLESDITKVQDRVRVQEQRSSMFGG